MSYPVRLTLAPTSAPRNRMTVAFRLILAIPHTVLAGPVIWIYRSGSLGLLGAAAYFLALINWFAILLKGDPLSGANDFILYYLRWRTRAVAYTALFVDEYPPFGDAPYPAAVDVEQPQGPRDRTSIAFRLFLALPHLIVLFFVLLGWGLTSIIAWFAILFTARYPASLLPFGLGAMRWLLRLEAYLLLLVDEYPPFELDRR